MQDTSPRIFTAHLYIEPDSFADGKTLAELIQKAGRKFKVVKIYRDRETVIIPLPDAVIRAGNRISVRDTPENLKEFEKVLGAKLYTDDTPVDAEHPLQAEDQQLAEIVVTQGSPLEGTSLSRVRFADFYQLVTLALHRAGMEITTLRADVGDVRLRIGDVPLVQGNREQIAALKRGGEPLVLDLQGNLLEFVASAPGFASALTLGKTPGGMLELVWNPDCGSGTAYSVYRGDLLQGYSSLALESGYCEVSATDVTVSVGPGEADFFIVVPHLDGQEGGYGLDSVGDPRPPATLACHPQADYDDCAP